MGHGRTLGAVQCFNRPRAVWLVAVALVTAAVLLAWPAGGSAVPATGALSVGGVSREQALVASLAPRLRGYELALSSLEAQSARAEAPPPIAPFGVPSVLGAHRASDAMSSMPPSVAALVSVVGELAGRARRALSALQADINDGAFTSPGGIAAAASQLARVLNPTSVPMYRLKQDVATIIGQLASTLPPVSLAVGPGQPMGSCPPSEDPIDCWILQSDHGAQLSNWLGWANVVASLAGMIAGVGEIPTVGLDTPLTISSDVVGTGTSVAQFYVDLVRKAGYDDSVVNKLGQAFIDAASVGTSIFDLGLLGDSLRLRAVDEAIEEAAPVVEHVVDATGRVIPAGEQLQKGVELVDEIAKLRQAKTALEARTDAKTIIGLLLGVITEYNGPASPWLNRLAKYLAQRVLSALGYVAPANHRASTLCQMLAFPPKAVFGAAL